MMIDECDLKRIKESIKRNEQLSEEYSIRWKVINDMRKAIFDSFKEDKEKRT